MKLIISKYIGQLKYIPTMAMYESLFRIASTLADSNEFEHWKAKRTPDSVLLFDNAKKLSLEVDSKSLTFTTEDGGLGRSTNQELTKYATLFLEPNNVNRFNRIGVRKLGIYEISGDYVTFVTKFIGAFLKEGNVMQEILADEFNDSLYIIESIKDGYSVRMQMAPLKPEQFDSHFPKSEYTKESPLKKDTNFILDVDVYRVQEDSKLSYDDMLERVEDAFVLMQKIYDEVYSLVESKTK